MIVSSLFKDHESIIVSHMIVHQQLSASNCNVQIMSQRLSAIDYQPVTISKIASQRLSAKLLLVIDCQLVIMILRPQVKAFQPSLSDNDCNVETMCH